MKSSSKAFHGIYWALFVLAFILLATGVYVDPGGPFISFFHEVVPDTLLLLSIGHALRGILLRASLSDSFDLFMWDYPAAF